MEVLDFVEKEGVFKKGWMPSLPPLEHSVVCVSTRYSSFQVDCPVIATRNPCMSIISIQTPHPKCAPSPRFLDNQPENCCSYSGTGLESRVFVSTTIGLFE